MEFDEMKKIWDEQNREPLYAINEAALHRSIQSKKERAGRISNINDFGLIAVALATAGIYSSLEIIWDEPNFYDYLIPVILLVIAGYVWIGRIRRKKSEIRFDRSILGDLDHAISSVSYEANRAKTMIWWFLLPLAVPTMLNMLQGNIIWWKITAILGVFILSHALIRWELNRCHIPRKTKLEALREKLVE